IPCVFALPADKDTLRWYREGLFHLAEHLGKNKHAILGVCGRSPTSHDALLLQNVPRAQRRELSHQLPGRDVAGGAIAIVARCCLLQQDMGTIV
ncbi:unnamed protein product, partial [Scytosiphon promiscuus]